MTMDPFTLQFQRDRAVQRPNLLWWLSCMDDSRMVGFIGCQRSLPFSAWGFLGGEELKVLEQRIGVLDAKFYPARPRPFPMVG